VIGRVHHLPAERLFECYVAERSGEPVDPPAAAHLADCGECGGRYRELERSMDDLRLEADAELDQLFPPERQEADQRRISRRLEHLGQAGHVITFPVQLVARHVVGTAARIVPYWAAAALAAGLLVGTAVGVSYDSRARVPAMGVSRPASTAPPAVAVTLQSASIDAGAFLSQLETALGGPQTPELKAFDVLTPQVREIALE